MQDTIVSYAFKSNQMYIEPDFDVANNFMLVFDNLPKYVLKTCTQSKQGLNMLVDSFKIFQRSKCLFQISGYNLTIFGMTSYDNIIQLALPDIVMGNRHLVIEYKSKIIDLTIADSCKILLDCILSIDKNIANIILEFQILQFETRPILKFTKKRLSQKSCEQQISKFPSYKSIIYIKKTTLRQSFVSLKEIQFPIKQLRIAFFDLSSDIVQPFESIQLQINFQKKLQDPSFEHWKKEDEDEHVKCDYPVYTLTFQSRNSEISSSLNPRWMEHCGLTIVWQTNLGCTMVISALTET